MSQASFLHIADLHLDSPFNSVSYLPPKLKELLKNASFLAFKKAVDFAIESKCDAVLIAGDIYDGVRTSSRAQVFFKECVQALSSAGIYSIIAHGNHDLSTDWALITEWPEKVIFLPNLGFDGLKIISNDGEEFYIVGSSAVFADVDSLRGGLNEVLDLKNIDKNKFIISVLHADISGKSPEGANYTSILPSGFISLPVNYWALGHIHQHSIVNENPHIVYPGTVQGRSLKPSECGEKGGVLVRIENGKIVETTFQAFSPITFRQINLRIDQNFSQGDLILEIKNLLGEELGSNCKPQIIRLHIETKLENRKLFSINSQEEEFISTLRDLVCREFFCSIERVKWSSVNQISSPLTNDLLDQIEFLIGAEFVDDNAKVGEILKSESLLLGIDTEVNLEEILEGARDRIKSILGCAHES